MRGREQLQQIPSKRNIEEINGSVSPAQMGCAVAERFNARTVDAVAARRCLVSDPASILVPAGRLRIVVLELQLLQQFSLVARCRDDAPEFSRSPTVGDWRQRSDQLAR